MRTHARTLATLATLALCATTQAQEYPTRTVRWIVPYLAGTAPDNTVRVVADAMGAILKQAVIVENKPLAQALFRTSEIGEIIPPDHYKAVAEVLAYVYRLKKKYS